MTQKEFEESMERILQPVKAYAESKVNDPKIMRRIDLLLKRSGYPWRLYETQPGGAEVKAIIDEINTLLGDWPYEIDEIRFLAFCFAKAGVIKDLGWEYVQKYWVKKCYWNPDLVAQRKIYDRMYNRVTPDMDFRERFKKPQKRSAQGSKH